MLTKKDQILDKARELFNIHGVLQTSTRDIANAAGMSQGNLTYHFNQKNDIIISLFNRLSEESSRRIAAVRQGDFTVEKFKLSFHENFKLLYKYRFLFLDFLNILREVDELKKQYAILNKQRKKEFHDIIDSFCGLDLLTNKLSLEEKDSLYTMYNIYFNFWLTDAEILYKGKQIDLVNHYETIAMQILLPYLNEAGRTLFSVV